MLVGACSAAAVVVACSASDPAPAPAGDALCSTYCNRILAECTGADTMYRDSAQCMTACKDLDPVNETGETGNTVKCRVGQLDKKNCRSAGPLGGGVCGQRCDGFCKIVQATCSTQAAPPYPDLGTCTEECNTVLRFDPAAPEGIEQPFTGEDTLNCRVQHLLLAFKDPNPHCNHVAVQSAQCRASASSDAGHD